MVYIFHMKLHCTIKVLFAYVKYQGFMQMGQPRGTPLTCFPPSAHSVLCWQILMAITVLLNAF